MNRIGYQDIITRPGKFRMPKHLVRVQAGSAQILIKRTHKQTIKLENKETDVILRWGYKQFTKFPIFKDSLFRLWEGTYEKMGITLPKQAMGLQTMIVEKYEEPKHHIPGFGNNPISELLNKGYNFKQIAKKLAHNYLLELNVVKTLPWLKLNLFLNEGITEIWDLVDETNAVDYYTNLLARCGVGNSVTAPAATQTGLLGASTLFKGQLAGFPTAGAGQRRDWKSEFISGEAEFAWEEYTTDNGVTPNANLHRDTVANGTKPAGQTWTLENQLTIA